MRAAGGLVHAAGLHAHQTVLHHVRNAHAVARGDFVAGFASSVTASIFSPLTATGMPCSKSMVHVFRLVRRRLPEYLQINGRSRRRLVGQDLPGRIPRERDARCCDPWSTDGPSSPGTGICRARRHTRSPASRVLISQIAPGRDDLHVSVANALMVSSKRTWSLPLPVQPWQMAVAALLVGDLNQTLGNQRTGKGGAQQSTCRS